MPSPGEVTVDVAVRATRLNDKGQPMPLVPNISITPRPGGLVVEIDWTRSESAPGPASAAGEGPAVQGSPDSAELEQRAQEWLTAKIRDWAGR